MLVGAVMWTVSRLDLGWSAGGRVPAAIVAGIGVAIAVAGIVQFARVGTTVDPHAPERTATLVDGGVYRLTRNPMYLGLALVLAGWGLALREPSVAIAGPFVFAAIITRLQIIPEERVLEARFSRIYADFRARTRRWI